MNEGRSFQKFMVVWSAQLLTAITSGLTAFSLGVYVFQETHAATSVAVVTLCSFLPPVLLAPACGVLADRFDRRVLMILGDAGSALGHLVILAALSGGASDLRQIYAGVTLGALFTALMGPAYKATVTDLLTEDQFAKASGLVQLAGSSQYLLSPVLAGFLLKYADLKVILIIDICTIPVTTFAALFIRKGLRQTLSRHEKLNFTKDLKEGWQCLVADKGVLVLVAVLFLATFYLGFLQTLLGPMVLSFADPETLGTVLSLSAAGMLLGALIIGVSPAIKSYVDMLCLGLGSAGVFLGLMGLRTEVPIITAAGFFFFSSLPFVNTGADVLIRKRIPNEQQGRAWGIIGILSQTGYIFAYAVSGILADRIFNPLLLQGGALAPTFGRIVGTGPGRGIGLLFLLSGTLMALLAFAVLHIKSIRALESA